MWERTLTDWLFLLSPWLALLCLIAWDARTPRTKNDKVVAQSNDSLSPDFGALIAVIQREGIAYRREEEREDRGKRTREWITIALIFVTFVAICYQVREMIKVYGPIKQQAEAARVAAKATARAADAATAQSENSDKSLTLSQRAWVGPTIARIDGAIEVGKPLKVVISYANSGREPATNFVHVQNVFTASSEDSSNGILNAKVLGDFKGCQDAQTLRPGQVVFPTTTNSSNNLTISTAANLVDQAVADGEKSVIVDGCFLYKSFEVIRHSYFCFFFTAKQTDPNGLSYCENGTNAD
jgi:hypothetical protein